MLKLKPSARAKRRYLLLKGNRKDIENSILEYVGIWGWAKAAPVFVKKSGENYVLAINRSETDKIIGSFAIYPEKIDVLKISGTLKGLGKK